MELTKEQMRKIYYQMFSSRTFEERVNEMFMKGLIHGTTHLAVGEEATAAGGIGALEPDDYIMSCHRGHAHCIAKGADVKRMMCELLGKKDGFCKGLGGSMHIVDISVGNYGANGVIGPAIPMATGVALAIKKDKSNKVILDYFGDGTSNSGLFHEALNMAALWKLPIVYMCENNLYGMSTPVENSVSVKDIATRAKAYGIPGVIVDGTDVLAIMDVVKEAADRARRGEGPTLIEAKTYRYLGHSKSDKRAYRTREEEAEWKAKDPIISFGKYMLEHGFTQQEIDDIRSLVERECEEAVEYAQAAETITLEEAKKLVFA
ncbi:thiamine pyrophosphate-dependent dehydrogenase E1 component subunit alpha [Christensenella timonensis]|uniref:thiamine pyrophosphate-dependent dehydrogenase E1 component subunit alpha n=1 Tax=Christensenella timonensis TaxID=1816678 RepID=UPI0008295E1D|nr:thiamine pyrophosphate-dependent dehydrogenase E1 component subunit alpha [Christensenella timonensis]